MISEADELEYAGRIFGVQHSYFVIFPDILNGHEHLP